MASTSAAPAINGDADATAKQNETIPKPTQDPTSKSGEESQNEGLQRNPTSNTTFSNSPEKSESTAATQDGVESEDATKVEEKPSFVKKTVDKLGLDVPTVLIMAKGGLPPVIALAIYQSHVVAGYFTTLGYLMAIVSHLSLCIQPRAKFIQSMTLNLVSISFASAIALLSIYCCVKARQHSSAPTAAYSAEASTVSAIWLCANVFIANYARAKRPQLQLPCIVYCIFSVVSATYAPQLTTVAAGEAFVRKIYTTFLSGFCIGIAVSLFILPINCRMIYGKQAVGFVGAVKATLNAHKEYMRYLADSCDANEDDQSEHENNAEASDHSEKSKAANQANTSKKSPQEAALAAAVGKASALIGTMKTDLIFVKRESAWGKLNVGDLKEVFNLFRDIQQPLTGLSTFMDVFKSSAELEERKFGLKNEGLESLPAGELKQLLEISSGPFEKLSAAMQEGLDHTLITLELIKPPKAKQGDEEADPGKPAPGSENFEKYLKQQLVDFNKQRETTLTRWCEQKGITLPSSFYGGEEHIDTKQMRDLDEIKHLRNQHQLYLILFVEFLTYSLAKNILKAVRFADSKVADGTMKKNRIIVPGIRRLKKWLKAMFAEEDSGSDDATITDGEGKASVYAGDALRARKDPEHLPPRNGWERFGNVLRKVPAFARSREAGFGFRAVVAMMSIGVVLFLRETQTFFLRQRLLWALIMVCISMGAHAGIGIFGFAFRIIGTVIAMCAALVIWYIVDEKAPGVIVLTWVGVAIGHYFLLKFPRFTVAVMISKITLIMILAYELQVGVIGIQVSESNGQPYYPIYQFAPYRLACVVGGVSVAFFWTIFPYPVTAHTTLRMDLGRNLYLLANYYSCVHTTVKLRMTGKEVAADIKGSACWKLDKARHKVFTKNIVLLRQLSDHMSYLDWEPTLGGAFPEETYKSIVGSMGKIFNYMTLISYSSRTFSTQTTDGSETAWIRDFRKFTRAINLTSHSVTSLMCLLSASVVNAQPLPPYLTASISYDLEHLLSTVDPGILSVSHVAEPCYAAFAVLQIASQLINLEVDKLVTDIRKIVGEVDFSFHVLSTAERAETGTDGDSLETLWLPLTRGDTALSKMGKGKNG